MDAQGSSTTREAALLEPLLAIHSAPSLAWLGDAACTAAERGLGAQHALFLTLDGSGTLAGQRPASAVRQRALLKLQQALGFDPTNLKFPAASKPVVAGALEAGATIAIELDDALPQSLEAEGLQELQRGLGVTEAWLTPLQAGGEPLGLLLLLMPPEPHATLAQADLLGRHAALALKNLRDHEVGRKRGELDAVRWIYDERRFAEELAQEARRAQRHDRALSLLLISVANLVDLQRRYGRFLVERVLRQVASRLSDAMRDTDFLGASGDDGFAALLVEADLDGAERAKQRLVDGLASLSLPGVDLPGLHIDVSCATATLPADAADAGELMSAAEACLRDDGPVSFRVQGDDPMGEQEEAAEPVLSRLTKRIQGKG